MTSFKSSPWLNTTVASVSVGWNPQLLQPPTWYLWKRARCADGKTVVTCSIVQAPDKSFGSVLTGAFHSINGFSERVSSSLLSIWTGAVSTVFFPKILDSNVAIVDFSFQCRPLRVRDPNGYLFTLNDIA